MIYVIMTTVGFAVARAVEHLARSALFPHPMFPNSSRPFFRRVPRIAAAVLPLAAALGQPAPAEPTPAISRADWNQWTLQPEAAFHIAGDKAAPSLKWSADQPRSAVARFQWNPAELESGAHYRLSVRAQWDGLENAFLNESESPHRPNLPGRGLCLAIGQRNASGTTFTHGASNAVLQPSGDKRLSVEVVVQPGARALDLELRAVGVTGEATFADLRLQRVDPSAKGGFPRAEIQTTSAGGRTFAVDGQRLRPLYFHGNALPEFDPAQIIEEMRHAYDAGVRIFSVNTVLPSVASVSALRQHLDAYIEAFPDAYFMIRVWLGPGGRWFKA